MATIGVSGFTREDRIRKSYPARELGNTIFTSSNERSMNMIYFWSTHLINKVLVYLILYISEELCGIACDVMRGNKQKNCDSTTWYLID